MDSSPDRPDGPDGPDGEEVSRPAEAAPPSPALKEEAPSGRLEPRVPVVGMRARYRSASALDFVQEHARDLGQGGLFIETEAPQAPGTVLRFDILLQDDQPLLSGVARVAWSRSPDEAAEDKPSGMGLQFLKLEESSAILLDGLLASASTFRDRPAKSTGAAAPTLEATALESAGASSDTLLARAEALPESEGLPPSLSPSPSEGERARTEEDSAPEAFERLGWKAWGVWVAAGLTLAWTVDALLFR